DSVQDGGHWRAGHVEHRRRDVDRVHVLVTDGARVGDGGPAYDQRVTDAAFVGLALPAPEGRVAGEGPAPWVVSVAVRAAQVVEHGEGLGDVVWQAVEDEVLVEAAVRAALGAGAVVTERDDQRPLELTPRGEEREEAPQVVVGVREEA